MLPTLLPSQNVFVEITNPVHGGAGWELGTCLWSPQKSSDGKATWQLMERVKQGDLIIHFVKLQPKLYFFYGISYAASGLKHTSVRPPIPDKWTNGPYQRVDLKDFSPVVEPVPVTEIFKKYRKSLIEILKSTKKGQFYTFIKKGVPDKDAELRMQQAYFVNCDAALYELLSQYTDEIGFNVSNDYTGNETGVRDLDVQYNRTEKIEPTPNEPTPPDAEPPGTKDERVTRYIRDTKLSRKVKKENKWKCQICGDRITLPSGNLYAEGHHIQPLGKKNNGLDVQNNILIVCPNHHAEFDYGSIAINPDTLLIEHIDKSNKWHGKALAYDRPLERRFIEYHYKKIFRK